MPKPKKSRRKPPQKLPRPSRDRGMTARPPSPITNDRLGQLHVGDNVTGLVTEVLPDELWVDINGVIGFVPTAEWPLPTGEMATDLYKAGDTVQDLFVWRIDREERHLGLSIRRNAPGYLNAFDKHRVGNVVSGTVMAVLPSTLWLDIDGVIGFVPTAEWPLPTGEMATDLYEAGDTVQDLFVWRIDRNSRELGLSIRRNAPGYLDVLDKHRVGDVVSGTATTVLPDELWLDVNGVISFVPIAEWPLPTGEMATDLYKTGDTVQDLFVWQTDRNSRELRLSIRRNVPGYLDAFDKYHVGDIVSGTAMAVLPDTLWLDIDGVIGAVPTGEWPLPTGEMATDLYKTGDTVQGLFVWWIDRDSRHLGLSIRRNMPGYLDTLDKLYVGVGVSGTATDVLPNSLWVDINGVIGVVPAGEWPVPTGEMATDLYKTRDIVQNLFVWQIDRESRMIILSNQSRAAELKAHAVGATIKAVVRGSRIGGINVLVASTNVFIPNHELDCFVERQFRFESNSEIDVVVLDIGDDGLANRLSHRRAIGDWKDYVAQFADGVLVSNAVVIPEAAMPDDEQRVAVDLGPITGYIREEEFSPADAAEFMSFKANHPLGVVIESVDPEGGSAIVSLKDFDARWQDLVAKFEVGSEVNAELRTVSSRAAQVDLGSGLLAIISPEHIPESDKPSRSRRDRIGETIPIRVTSIDYDNHHITAEHRDQWLEALIGESESQTLEFKAVLKGDESADDTREMTREAIRTVVGFLNTDGGRLIIGIEDSNRDVVGLEADQGLAGDTIDKKIDSANQILHSNLQNIHSGNPLEDFDIVTLVVWETVTIRGKTLLIVSCDPGPESGANWIVKGKSEFYARKGDSTERLHTREAIRDHLVKRNQRAAVEDEDR